MMAKYGLATLFNTMGCILVIYIGLLNQVIKYIGMIKMKKLTIFLFFCVFSSFASPNLQSSADYDAVVKQAVRFNQWYLKQVRNDKYPITDSKEIDKYVSADTLRKLRHAQTDDNQYYDFDFFTRVQDDGDFTDNVKVLEVSYDPVCMNVYIDFGKDKPFVVVDCFVKENGVWKIRSVNRTEVLK